VDTRTAPTTRRAISYARFSSGKQADGFSLTRQIEAAAAYCKRNGLTLDERTYQDLGVSAYDGANARTGDLAEFIELAKAGRIPKGSVLVVENTDRLSRLPPDEATQVIMEIVNCGIDVVTLSPEQLYNKKTIHSVGVWVPLQVGIVLAHEESMKKAARLSDAWARKRAALAAGVKLTKRCPFWLRLAADRKSFVVVERWAALVRKMFDWAAGGLGSVQIAARLDAECPEGVGGKGWQPSNVLKVLRSRAVLGEFQAKVGVKSKKRGEPDRREPAGETVRDYFPAIIPEALYYRARDAIASRKTTGGGGGDAKPNIFSGLLHDARDGRRMVINGAVGRRWLVSAGAVRGKAGSRYISAPYDVIQAAVIALLKELKTKDVVGTTAPADDEVEKLSGRLTTVNEKIAQTQRRVKDAADPGVYLDLLDDLGRERKEVIAALEAAKGRAANPAGDVLGEVQSLADLLADAEPGEERDDLLRKVKAALGRLVAKAWALVVPLANGRDKAIALQLFFREGGSRSMVLGYRPQGRGGPLWSGVSLHSAGVTGVAASFDLRRPADAKAMERALAELDPAELIEAEPEKPGKKRARKQ
jgi:DNA invertase Pin-like site-specific DNA recombinase